jgi:hypothetical protein
MKTSKRKRNQSEKVRRSGASNPVEGYLAASRSIRAGSESSLHVK